MKRLWPFVLLVLPVLGLIGRVDRHPSRPRITALPAERREAAVTTETSNLDAPDPAPSKTPAEPEWIDVSVSAAEIEPAIDLQAWKRYPISSAIVWFAHHQNEDGSFGDGPVALEGHMIGRTGVTSLALLSCMGYGYSHLSKDVLDGMEIGGMVKRAVKWLVANPVGNGFDRVLATLALSEAYGMTASAPLKQPAADALEALGKMQEADGSWGGPGPTAWALLAVRSAELSELPVAGDVRERGLRYNMTSSHPSALWNRIVLEKNREDAAVRAAALAASPPAPGDFAAWYHAVGSMMQADRREGTIALPFFELMKQTLLPQHEPGGAWLGSSVSHTVVQSSLAMLTLEQYWHSHGSVFTPGK
jgi:hypothetical protein